MKKTNLILLIVVIILAVLIVGGIVWKLVAGPQYSAVYLTSGDIYFGELTHFPNYGLENVYTIQVTQNEENPLSVQKFENVFWGPKDFMNLNKENVIWTVGLDSQGQMAQLFENNPNLQPQQPANTGQMPQQQMPAGGQQQAPQPGASE
ncbi:MAG TPA: hypothetical protein VKO61_00705 [Candidatus Paceibacterota bacterium]|nr:hypothetical protein [Candidatus Paceibacterota bacterium]